MKTTKFNDNTDIPLITDIISWGSATTPGYCLYTYNIDKLTYQNTYGALYNWYAVNTRKLCPLCWHVPSDEEWTTLATYLGGASVAGGKLKETDTTHWKSPNTEATNESGFTALPGGYRNQVGAFFNLVYQGRWWSATEYSALHARYLLWSRAWQYTLWIQL